MVPEGVAVTVVADRGFADCNLFKYLEEDLGFSYVIRLPGSSYVTSQSGERRLASQWVRPTGRIRTLRGAQVTDAHRLTVGTVVCLRDKDMKDCWCLVASDPNATPGSSSTSTPNAGGSKRAFATSRTRAMALACRRCASHAPTAVTD